ncbi:M20/M25/M40 family metallo-hydrolase [Sphingomonas abietis]|uniref:Vacuolar membrane protease n=1 Tax=Sphingomonas abietis TaxID=3012344 RepID=A0ABY7NKE7_9SPHN|nr:M20/M25/M40 family metallo-hydrolase [Sphingomonas abietis]WBO22017.1 M20/M25/M40 family metallo-hydrolase [Sphingomonas abietis]
MSHPVRIACLLIAIVVSLWIGVRAATPPPVVPASAPATAFSAERALPDIHALAMRPHPTASADSERVHAYLEKRLRAIGIVPEERRYLIDPEGFATLHRWNPQASRASEMADIVGVLPGRDRTRPAVALMAHMDTVWGSPGGGDDSVGVAAILEILRAIRAQGTPTRDIVVLFTDGEEIGLSGARAFWPSDGVARHVGVVINLEARGAGGRATMFETGNGNGAMMALFGQAVRHPVANAMSVLAYRLMPNDTDFTPIREQGLPGFNFAIMGRPEYYHSPRATADRLDPRALQDMGDQALDLASALATARMLPAATRDAVFFDVAGHHLLIYSPAAGWLIVLAAGLALAAAVLGLRRHAGFALRGIGGGIGAFLWLIAHGLLLLLVLNLVSGSAAHPNYYDRLAALPRLEMQAVLACLTTLIGWLTLRRFPYRAWGLLPGALLGVAGWKLGGPHLVIVAMAVMGMLAGWLAPVEGVSRWNGWIGAIAMLLLVALLLQGRAPLVAWIFAWPALILALAACLVAWTDPGFQRPWGAAIPALALALVVAPLIPLAHLAFLGVGAPMAPVMLAFLLIVAAAVWPLAKIGQGTRTALVIAGALVAVGLVIAVQVRTDPIAATIPAYSLDK